MNYSIHPLSEVQSTNIGEATTIWQFCVILKDARIGRHCNINFNVFIENDVIIGDYVTIKSGVQLWDGLRVGDHVFIGPNVTFTNDHVPRAGIYPEKFDQTILEKGASIGANATILVGITIGHYALIGAGSVVTRSIPPFTVWYGNPAKQQGYVTKSGIIVSPEFKDKHGNNYQLINGEPERL